MEIVAADIGGTHARFAIAEADGGKVTSLGEAVTLKVTEFASLQTAWEAFARRCGRALPKAAAIALATPIEGDVLQMTNNPWIIRPSLIEAKLGVSHYTLVNDFGAVAHAVDQLPPENFRHLFGPDEALPEEGVISIVGPGTGLGVGQLLRRGGASHVIETEGGHIDFAPLDGLEDGILARLRQQYRRVSVERVISGPGLRNIYEALAAKERRHSEFEDDKALWTAALEGSNSLAAAALDRFCMSLGSVSGDIALAQGAKAVVIAGGVGRRIADVLPRSGFAVRFRAKGRFESRMASIGVRLITHPEPGLFGAAASFAKEHTK
jgi:glucokinase